MLNRTRYHFAGCVLVVATILFATGCSGSSIAEDAGQKAQAAGWRFEFPGEFSTTDELQKYLGRESLGGRVNVQVHDRLVFAQTFPYSGVQASHLFICRKSDTDLTFFLFFLCCDAGRGRPEICRKWFRRNPRRRKAGSDPAATTGS